ncbi:hypothetical protein CAPTEDRAFT_222006 [Capitella teleta]|uniref:SEA domain-containing protein n=1 Tax=Capitella teleta TaxID=283909 RepID=R7VKN7_CAPTE|nr:hypothetical protein CAPTEDRAFT_222006 [Capitella teleta]|eukprot:ELU16915.1 hypothetical protein CAPTEDRAFT_222006 [Capitella teleta]
MRWLLIYFVVLLMASMADAARENEESVPEGCKVCRIDLDDFSGCWNNSLTHFTKNVEADLNQLVSSFIHFSRWKKVHDTEEDFKDAILEQTLTEYEALSEEDRGPLSAADFRLIFDVIFNRTRAIEPRFEDEIYLPTLVCPTPCGYADRMYVALFFVLVIAFFLAVIVFLVYLFLIHRKTDREGQFRTMRDNRCADLCAGF